MPATSCQCFGPSGTRALRRLPPLPSPSTSGGFRRLGAGSGTSQRSPTLLRVRRSSKPCASGIVARFYRRELFGRDRGLRDIEQRIRIGDRRTVVDAEAPTHDDAGVGTWHKTDMPTALRKVRYQGQSGKHLLAVSISLFDPDRTSAWPKSGADSVPFPARHPVAKC